MLKQTALFYFFLVFIVGNNGYGQEFDNFRSLKSSGELPKTYFEAVTTKVKTAKSKRDNIGLSKDFFASSEIFVDDLLRSGKLLVNGALSEYVQSVAQYVLRNDSTLLNKLSFYVLKSNDVNAFSTDPGVIVITTGLLAQLDNEAELAFILAHEITHYVKKHVRNNYLEYRKILREDPYNYRSRNLQKIVLYSQSLEFEADSVGMEYLLQTDYNLNAVKTAFEILVYSYLPFEDVQFDLNFLNIGDVEISNAIMSDTINEIDGDIFYDDSHMSHPNIGSRIENGISFDQRHGGINNKKLFIIDKEAFEYAKTASRFESINLYLESTSYIDVIYSAFILSKDFKDNFFLELGIGKALYGLSKYKLYNRYDEVTYDLSTIEGESYKLHSLFENIRKEELYILTVAYFEKLSVKYPNQRILKKYLTNIKLDVEMYQNVFLDQFMVKNTNPQFEDSLNRQIEAIDSAIYSIQNIGLSKLAKIQQSKKLQAEKLAISNIIDHNQSYYGWLSDCISSNENYINEWKAMPLFNALDTVGYRFDTTKYNMGIDSIIILDPVYIKYDITESVKDYKSRSVEIMVDELLIEDYPNLPLGRYSLSTHSLSNSNNISTYNQMSLLKRYFDEILSHDNMNMIASQHDEVQMLTDSVNINKILLTYIFSSRVEVFKKKVYPLLLYTVVGVPIILADLIQSNYVYCSTLIVDTDVDKISAIHYESINLAEQKWQMKPYIYSVLKNINSKPEEK
ncbi:MAG: M48 family metallopeptidase [Crocinitomicaceae bacterium]